MCTILSLAVSVFGLCFCAISIVVITFCWFCSLFLFILISPEMWRRKRQYTNPSIDRSTDPTNERFAVIFIIRRWKLIATKMKNIKWLDLWRREVKIGNRVWEFRIMFVFCVCVRLRFMAYSRVRVRHRYKHIHIYIYNMVYEWQNTLGILMLLCFSFSFLQRCVNVFFAFFQFLFFPFSRILWKE